jgi:hypothetical protein
MMIPNASALPKVSTDGLAVANIENELCHEVVLQTKKLKTLQIPTNETKSVSIPDSLSTFLIILMIQWHYDKKLFSTELCHGAQP